MRQDFQQQKYRRPKNSIIQMSTGCQVQINDLRKPGPAKDHHNLKIQPPLYKTRGGLVFLPVHLFFTQPVRSVRPEVCIAFPLGKFNRTPVRSDIRSPDHGTTFSVIPSCNERIFPGFRNQISSVFYFQFI